MKRNGWLLIGLGLFALYAMNKQPGTTTPGTTPGTEPVAEQTLLQQWIDRIKNDPTWYDHIVSKTSSTGMTIEQQLAHDAQWAIDQGWQL